MSYTPPASKTVFQCFSSLSSAAFSHNFSIVVGQTSEMAWLPKSPTVLTLSRVSARFCFVLMKMRLGQCADLLRKVEWRLERLWRPEGEEATSTTVLFKAVGDDKQSIKFK